MRRPRRPVLTALAVLALTASPTLAQDEDAPPPEARLFAYGKAADAVTIEGNAAGNYGMLILLAVLAVGGLFKNANRSHLD